MSTDLSAQAESIARHVGLMLIARPDHLSAITVAGGEGLAQSDVARIVEAALAEVGVDFVDVRFEPKPGPLRLVSAWFEPM